MMTERARSKGSFIHLALTVLMLAAIGLPLESQETPYDSFSSSLLDADLWIGTQAIAGFGSPLEVQRVVEGGRLLMLQRTVGNDVLDFGITQGFNQLFFRDAADLTGVSLDVTPTAAIAQTCSGAGAGPTASLRAAFGLFNDGLGNVISTIAARRTSTTPPGVLDVIGILSHRVTGLIGSADLGTVALGDTVTLGMVWDAAANSVEYSRDGGSPVVVSYTNDDSLPATEGKAIEALNFAPNCDGQRRQAGIIALVDNVMVAP